MNRVLELFGIAVLAFLLVCCVFFVAGANGGTLIIAKAPPPARTAHALPAKVAHHRRRMAYLARSCAALDYWHVICPERYHP